MLTRMQEANSHIMSSKILLILIGMLTLVGCKRYDVQVDSICSIVSQPKKKYILVSGNQDEKANELQYQEFASYTDKILCSKGLKWTPKTGQVS